MSGTVILGAGIVGCSTAYYLSQSGRTQAESIHLVEASPELFHCASGLAGGFLAKDWFSPAVASLGELSFKLHKELAEANNGKESWGYSKSTGTSLSNEDDEDAVGGSGEDWLSNGTSRAEAAGQHKFDDGDGPAWLARRKGSNLEIISRDDSTAQIDPLRLSRWLLNQCLPRGIRLHHPAKAISVSKDQKGQLSGVRIQSRDDEETEVPCTRLIITAGAWSPRVFSALFPSSNTKISVSSLAGHSLLLKSPGWTPERDMKGCHAVFSTDELGFSPEFFSRTGGELYLAGLNSTMIPLPEISTDAKVDPKAIEQLKNVSRKLLGLPEGEDNLQILREGLCFRPVTGSGRPIVSRIPDSALGKGVSTKGGGEGGVFLAAGHGAWGIAQSLGTGKVMSQLVEGQKTSADISSLALRL